MARSINSGDIRGWGDGIGKHRRSATSLTLAVAAAAVAVGDWPQTTGGAEDADSNDALGACDSVLACGC
jgi:hypothetical protein